MRNHLVVIRLMENQSMHPDAIHLAENFLRRLGVCYLVLQIHLGATRQRRIRTTHGCPTNLAKVFDSSTDFGRPSGSVSLRRTGRHGSCPHDLHLGFRHRRAFARTIRSQAPLQEQRRLFRLRCNVSYRCPPVGR